ncbi:MAG: AAA family ATPase [Clostridia bacterium]|nr:AAA family ATPase [Clostridia bacterium]
MKLVRCHIENFGKITGKDFEFGEGVTAYLLGNGGGKSTFAEFLTVMLYGMETQRESKESKVEVKISNRKTYYPFSGGNYGGTLEFTAEKNGRNALYRVERTFDKTSKTRDTVVVYVDGVETVFENPVGEELLGINEESFRKIMFMTGDSMQPGATNDISQKLGSSIVSDDGHYETAVEQLDKQLKKYDKKGSGKNNTLIAECERNISELRAQAAEYRGLKKTLSELYERRGSLAEQLAALKAEEEAERKQKELADACAYADELRKNVGDAETEYRNILSGYPSGFPEDAEILTVKDAVSDYLRNENVLSGTVFPAEKEAELRRFEEICASVGGLDDAKIEEIGRDVEKAEASDAALDSLRAVAGAAEADSASLRETFAGREEAVAKALEMLPEAIKKRDEADREVRAFGVENYGHDAGASGSGSASALAVAEKLRKAGIALAVAALLTLAGGVVFTFVKSGVAWLNIALFVAGFVLLAAGIVLFALGARGRKQAKFQREAARAKAEADLKEAKEKIVRLTGVFGNYGDDAAGAERFRIDAQNYRDYVEKISGLRERISAEVSGAGPVKQRLGSFFEKCSVQGGSLREKYINLKNMAAAAENLKAERESVAAKRAQLRSAVDAELGVVNSFFEKYTPDRPGESANPYDRIKALEVDKAFAAGKLAEIETRKTRLLQFVSEKNIPAEPVVFDPARIEEIAEKKEKTAQSANFCDSEIKRLESRAELIIDADARMEEENRKLDEYRRVKRDIEKTKQLIKDAYDSIVERYIKPVLSKFDHYRGALNEVFGGEITVNRNFNVEFTANGIKRGQEHLSKGQLAAVGLCVKLALIDVLYGDKTNFIVLDDPFVNLDAQNMRDIATILGEIAGKRQIIYLTCHESRMIESSSGGD